MNRASEKAGQLESIQFGDFQLWPAERQLRESGRSVKLGARAFDILAVLIENAGKTVTKKDLMTRVWPTTVVDEINLRVHVAALRRALGDGQNGQRFIVNVTGRGYSFVAPLSSFEDSAPAPRARSPQPSHNLPTSLTRMIGRDVELVSLSRLLRSQRLLTIVGAGGVGKTTIALAVARSLLGDFPHGVRFVELAPVREATGVANAFATALGLAVSRETPTHDLREFTRDKNLLLLVDNCEHVIAEVATIVEQLLRSSNDLRVFATSREPLNAEGEWLFRITPLDVPAETRTSWTAAKVREHAAVKLFVERAMTGEEAFDLTDENAELVAGICRTLDGLPLAIELAAASVDRLGLRELAVRVHDQVSRGSAGRRTAASRHQTLRATFDWSFELLNPLEKLAFRRLAIFSGSFTMESASLLMARAGADVQEAVGAVMGLAEKSLISTDITSVTLRHRFLNTVRTYAFEKLRSSDDFLHIRRWHAEEILGLMRQAELGWASSDRSQWIAAYGHAIDDVRAALDWAFSAEGDTALGTALTAISVPFGIQLAHLEEFRARIEHALYWVTAGPVPQPEIELRLRDTLSHLTSNMQRSEAVSPVGDAVDRIEAPKNRISPLLRKTIFEIESADYDAALESAARLANVAREAKDPLADLASDRVSAQAHHFAGNHEIARAYAERVMNHPSKSIPITYVPVQTDRRVWMRIVLGRAFWIQGQAEQAQQVAAEALELAAADSPFALCQALAFAACPISIWSGELDKARQQVRTLMAETRRYRLENWRAYAEWYECVLDADMGAADSGTDKPGSARSSIPLSIGGLLLDTILTMNPWITGADPLSLAAVGWAASERLRVQGEFILRNAAPEAFARAEAIFLQSLQLAESQRALGWRLRSAISLGRFWSEKKNLRSQSRLLLEDVCGRFTEGLKTRDFRTAQSLISELA
jgi:predicted ATPase/DNA-binding winged helix-turn-helix (wHTH) protein